MYHKEEGMVFTKDAKKKGITNIISGVIAIIVVIVLQIFVFSKPDVPTGMIAIVWILAIIVPSLFIRSGLSLIKTGGSWEVRVDEEGISWQSPDENIDPSFHFKLSEMEGLETRFSKTAKNKKYRYYIKLKNGSEQKLSGTSGINIIQVIIELERLGLPNETVGT